MLPMPQSIRVNLVCRGALNQANLPQNWAKLAILDVLFSWYRESSNSTVFWTQKKPYQWKSILLEEFLWYKLVSRGFKKSKVHFLTAKSRAVLVWAFFSFSAISSNSHLGWEIRKVLFWMRNWDLLLPLQFFALTSK